MYFCAQVRLRGAAAELNVLFGAAWATLGLVSVPRGAAGRMYSGVAVQRMGAALFAGDRLEQGGRVGRRAIIASGQLQSEKEGQNNIRRRFN